MRASNEQQRLDNDIQQRLLQLPNGGNDPLNPDDVGALVAELDEREGLANLTAQLDDAVTQRNNGIECGKHQQIINQLLEDLNTVPTFVRYMKSLGHPGREPSMARDYLDIQAIRMVQLCIVRHNDRLLYELCQRASVQQRVKQYFNSWNRLHQAAAQGTGVAVLILLKAGCDVNSMTRTGESPLHIAVQYGNFDAVSALLAYGCMDVPDRINGRLAISQALFRYQFAEEFYTDMINSQDSQRHYGAKLAPGGQPISVDAIVACYQQIVTLIEQARKVWGRMPVDWTLSRNQNNDSLLHCYARARDIKGLENAVLSQQRGMRVIVNQRNALGETPLMVLALSELFYHEPDSVRLVEQLTACYAILITAGADVRLRDVYGRSLLDLCLQNLHLKTFAFFIDQNVCPLQLQAFPRAVYSRRIPPQLLLNALYQAFTQRKRSGDGQGDGFIHYVLRAFADDGERGWTDELFSGMAKSLERYVEQRSVDIAAMLDERNDKQQTPLMLVVTLGDARLTQSLLDEGADVLAQDGKGNYPLEVARQSNHLRLKSIVLEATKARLLGRLNRPIIQAIREQDYKQGFVDLLYRFKILRPGDSDGTYRAELMRHGVVLPPMPFTHQTGRFFAAPAPDNTTMTAGEDSSELLSTEDSSSQDRESMDWDAYGAEAQRLHEEGMLLQQQEDAGNDDEANRHFDARF